MKVATLSWPEFQRHWAGHFRQGHHVAFIGPTGVGKTTAATHLVKPRLYVVAFGTKPEDDTLAKLLKDGWIRIEKWPPPAGKKRVVLWPKVKEPDAIVNVQRKVFNEALNGIYKQRSWCVWLDELYWMSVNLRMKNKLQTYYTHARSLHISLVGVTQRPSWVPVEAYSQAGHLILWRTNFDNDLKKIGSMNGVDSKVVVSVLGQLDYREFLHVDLIRQSLTVSKVDMKGSR